MAGVGGDAGFAQAGALLASSGEVGMAPPEGGQGLAPLGGDPPKRPRGRPRKRGRRPVAAGGEPSDGEDRPPKRRRGRPPGTGKKQRAAKLTSGRGSPSDKKSNSFGSAFTLGSNSEVKSLENMTKSELAEALKAKNRRKRYVPRLAPPS
eukprot:evm.model.scf_1635EXC.1 EVM.evm.TU.scf_1635EXC.1   scf_1635EXC:1145-2113(+)